MFLYQDFFGKWHTTDDKLIPPSLWFVRVDAATLPSLMQTLQTAFGKDVVHKAMDTAPPASGAYEDFAND